MSKRDVIWVDGERELFLNMQRVMGSNLSAARQGIRAGAMSIINDAKQNLRGNHSVVTGQLRASGRVQAVQGDEDAVDAGFFSNDTQGGYAYFVEYGRRSGKMPPVDCIVQWFRKKFGLNEKEAKAGAGFCQSNSKEGNKTAPILRTSSGKEQEGGRGCDKGSNSKRHRSKWQIKAYSAHLVQYSKVCVHP